MEMFLTFLFIFDFRFIKSVPLSSSALVVLVFLFIRCLVDRNANREIVRCVQNPYNKKIFRMLLLIIVISLVAPLVHGSYDFSYGTTLIHQLLVLFIGMLLVAYYQYRNVNTIETIINAFFIQSIIQILCFVSSDFLRITDWFRSDDLIAKRYLSYRGFRGLAISGSAFFGLAVAYAIVFVVLAFYMEKWDKPIIRKVITVACMTFGALSAGRTAIAGVAIFAVVLVIKFFRTLSADTLRRVFVTIGVVAVMIAVFSGPITKYLQTNQSWTFFRYYLFQFLENDTSGRGASLSNITSLNHMINDMYFRLEPSQFFFGDGFFSNPDGSYYMHTDVGLMRNLLFFGIFCTFLLYRYHYIFIMYNARGKRLKIIAITLFLLSVIMEIKGQTMGFMLISQSMFYLICSNYYLFEDYE